MNSQLSIGETALLLDINPQTLRRWDGNRGKLSSNRLSSASHRYYTTDDIENFLSDNFKYLLRMAIHWSSEKEAPILPPRFYCADRSIFKARLSKLESALMRDSKFEESYSLIVSMAGEIGNNSYDHNLGNWPDISGIFFGYCLGEKKIILADRGQGILKTLQRIKKELANDTQALRVAFTEVISGRSPERRGNGLKYVRGIIERSDNMKLYFHSGDAVLNLTKKTKELNIMQTTDSLQGCLVIIEY